MIFCKRLQTYANYIPLERIFCHEYKFGIIISKEGFLWLRSTCKISVCIEIRVDDLSIVVGNIRYHFEEGSVLSILVPRFVGGLTNERQRNTVNARLGHWHCTCRHRCELASSELAPDPPSESPPPACVHLRSHSDGDRNLVVSLA